MTQSTPTPGLIRVTRLGLVNAYLVPEDDGLTLIDTSIKGADGAILVAAEALGRPIVRIALTHAHGDHVGSLDKLATALPGVEVAISARDARLLRKDLTLDPDEPTDGRLRPGQFPGATTRPTRTLAAGDRVGSLEVVAAPGHSPGHVAFLDTRDGTLFTGDAFFTIGGITTAAKPLRFPLLALLTWHRPTALATAARLRDLQPARLAVGHGPVVEDPGAAMAAAVGRGGA